MSERPLAEDSQVDLRLQMLHLSSTLSPSPIIDVTISNADKLYQFVRYAKVCGMYEPIKEPLQK